jgi:hypothetical protein
MAATGIAFFVVATRVYKWRKRWVVPLVGRANETGSTSTATRRPSSMPVAYAGRLCQSPMPVARMSTNTNVSRSIVLATGSRGSRPRSATWSGRASGRFSKRRPDHSPQSQWVAALAAPAVRFSAPALEAVGGRTSDQAGAARRARLRGRRLSRGLHAAFRSAFECLTLLARGERAGGNSASCSTLLALMSLGCTPIQPEKRL